MRTESSVRTIEVSDAQSEHVSDLSKEDLVVLLQDLREADLTLDMEVIAACNKWGIIP